MNGIAIPAHYEALFDAMLDRSGRRGEPDWLRDRRRGAFDRLRQDGFPTIRAEAWRYTNLRPVLEEHFTMPPLEPPSDIGGFIGGQREDEAAIVFIDGAFAPEHSRVDGIAGVRFTAFADALHNGGAADLRARLEAARVDGDATFAALNTAFCTGGGILRIAPDTIVGERLHLLFLTTGTAPGILVAPRLWVEVGRSSEVAIVSSYIGHPGAKSLTMGVTDLQVGENAHLTFSKVQSESADAFHFSTTRSRQDANSRVRLLDFSRGARLARNDLWASLDGEGAEVHLDGLYAVRDKQHVDNHTAVDHRVPRCLSRQIYKGILNDRARAVFNGKVFVRRGARLTDGYQLNRNLLLSRSARVDTKPQLEIDNDDVKCTHGATVGQIDEDQCFYLTSRGIPKPRAIAMLSRGFVEDVLFAIRDKALRDSLHALLDSYFEPDA